MRAHARRRHPGAATALPTDGQGPAGAIGVDGRTEVDRPLHILVVTNLYPSREHPAFGTFVGARVAELRRVGQRVDVAAITDDRAHVRVGPKYAGLAMRAFAAILGSRLRRDRYDVVETHIAFPTGLIAWPAARIGGAPLVLFAHGSDVLRLPWSSPRRAGVARRLFQHADLVVANSHAVARVAMERLGPLRRAPIVASPGIDVPAVADHDGPRDAAHVLFVGRLVRGKGCHVLLAAMERLAQAGTTARLTIIGGGPERTALELAATSAPGLAGRVRFTGPLPPQDVATAMGRATVVVVPSIEPEGLGLVALEAMAHGALVVATRSGALTEFMRDGENGRVVPPDDDQALAMGIGDALAAAVAPVGDRWRAAGRRTASAHDRRLAVAATLDAYRRLSLEDRD